MSDLDKTRMIAMAKRIRELQIKVEVLTLENELLGELNENLRQWLLANTTAVAGIMGQMSGDRKHS